MVSMNMDLVVGVVANAMNSLRLNDAAQSHGVVDVLVADDYNEGADDYIEGADDDALVAVAAVHDDCYAHIVDSFRIGYAYDRHAVVGHASTIT